MAFLSKGGQITLFEGGTENPCFCPVGKNCKFLSEGGLKKRCPRWVTFSNKVGKIVKINCPRGGGVKKSCLRWVKFTKKKCQRGVKSAGKTVRVGKIGQNCLGG